MRKLLLPTLGLLLASTLPTFALSGGPFQNDSSLETGANGTYQGTVRGENIIGVVVFGWSSSGGGSGRYAIFNKGFSRVGDLAPVVDLPSRTVAAVFGGDAFTGTVDNSGAFDAKIKQTQPILTFTGGGQVSGPSEAITDTDTTDTASVTVTDTVTSGGLVQETVFSTETTDVTGRMTADTVPVTVTGFRSSTIPGVFSTSFITGGATGTTGQTNP